MSSKQKDSVTLLMPHHSLKQQQTFTYFLLFLLLAYEAQQSLDHLWKEESFSDKLPVFISHAQTAANLNVHRQQIIHSELGELGEAYLETC